MKLVTFRVATPIGTFTRVGAIHDQSYVDVNMAYARWLADQREAQPYRMANAQVPVTMLEFLEGGPSTMAAARRAIDYALTLGPSHKGPAGETIFYHGADVPIAAPLPNPPSLRDFIAFEDHIAATSKKRGQPIPPEWYKAPVYYKGNHRTIIGPDEDLPWPLETTKLDYELELACVIGCKGKDIAEREAQDYIAGYTIMNDFLGPCLVTPDEITDLGALTMVARVNGEEWSRGRFGTIHWSFPHMIAHVSRGEMIYPGDVFGSGTVGGGCGLEMDRYLKPGDMVELEIQPIGVLRTRVVGAT